MPALFHLFEKRNGSLPYRFFVLGLHTTIVFLTGLLLFVDQLNRTVFLCVLFVAGSHFAIDAVRLRIERWIYPKTGETPTHSKRRDLSKLIRFFKNPRTAWSERGFPEWFLLNVLDQCFHLLILILAASYLVKVL